MTFLRSAAFWRTYAALATLAVIGGLACVLVVGRQMERTMREQLESNLRGDALLLSPWATRVLAGAEPADRQLAAAPHSGIRVTLLRADGAVVVDTARDALALENHADRPEIVQARTAGIASAQRRSESLGVDLLYVAQRIDAGDQAVGFLRLSIPLAPQRAARGALYSVAAAVVACALVLALPIAALLERRRDADLAELTRVVEEQRGGRLEARVRALPDGGIGELGGAINQLGDDLARRIATLSVEDARLRAMLAGMVEGVVALDASERVAFSNGAAQRLLEPTGGTLDGRRLWEVVRIPELVELLEEARATSATCARELALSSSRGELVLQVHASRFSAAGAGAGLVLVFHDITELRRLERIRRDFVANVGHELKTPLTAISGYVETLLDGALDSRADLERFLARIQANTQRLSHLVSDLLSLARIESGKSIVRIEPLGTHDAIDQALREHEPGARAKSLALELARDSVDLRVLADAEAVRQILDNLIDNAIKYTQRGTVRVRSRDCGEFVCLEVEDTGIGIPEQDRERVFERFFTVDRARSSELGGTGLGLSIVRHLVSGMRGRLELDSELGRGSTFRVLLPRSER